MGKPLPSDLIIKDRFPLQEFQFELKAHVWKSFKDSAGACRPSCSGLIGLYIRGYAAEGREEQLNELCERWSLEAWDSYKGALIEKLQGLGFLDVTEGELNYVKNVALRMGKTTLNSIRILRAGEDYRQLRNYWQDDETPDGRRFIPATDSDPATSEAVFEGIMAIDGMSLYSYGSRTGRARITISVTTEEDSSVDRRVLGPAVTSTAHVGPQNNTGISHESETMSARERDFLPSLYLPLALINVYPDIPEDQSSETFTNREDSQAEDGEIIEPDPLLPRRRSRGERYFVL